MESNETRKKRAHLCGLLTRLAQVRRPRLRVHVILERALLRLGVRPCFLLVIHLGLVCLAWSTVVEFCGFGSFILSLRRFFGGILRLMRKNE